MKNILHSLNAKTAITYLLLAVLIITVITGLIFENQSELIVKNTLLEAEKVVYNANDEIQKLVKAAGLEPGKRGAERLGALLDDSGINTFAVLNDQADVLSIRPESDRRALSDRNEFVNINRAVFKKENTRKIFHAEIAKSPAGLKEQQNIVFYMPVAAKNGENFIVRLPVSIQGIDMQMQALYRQTGLLVAGMIAILAVFAWVYNRMVIRPVKLISSASLKVAGGDYSVHVSVKNDDEIGVLSKSFNGMVDALEVTTTQLRDNIVKLEEQNEIIQDELDIARTIQEGMLPQTVKYDRMILSAYYRALEKISGDFYDVIEFPDGSNGIFIADVSGHGIPAALITIMTKFILYTFGPELTNPDELMGKMNHDIARIVKTGDYVTAYYMIIDPSNTVRFVNAGHHAPFLYRRRTGEIEELKEQGTFLGILEDLPAPYHVGEAKLEKGDRLVLYTDGVTEQMDASGAQYTEERLRDFIMSHADDPVERMVALAIEDVITFTGSSERLDDYTLIAIDITAEAAASATPRGNVIPITKAMDDRARITAENYMKSAMAMRSDALPEDGRDADGERPSSNSIRLIKNGSTVEFVDIPVDLACGAFNGTTADGKYVRVPAERIKHVPADRNADREIPEDVLIRVVQNTRSIEYIDISKKLLSTEKAKTKNTRQNFVRIKSTG